jgi:hypothetical protein
MLSGLALFKFTSKISMQTVGEFAEATEAVHWLASE